MLQKVSKSSSSYMTVNLSVTAGSMSGLPTASTFMRNLRRSIEALSSAILMLMAQLPEWNPKAKAEEAAINDESRTIS